MDNIAEVATACGNDGIETRYRDINVFVSASSFSFAFAVNVHSAIHCRVAILATSTAVSIESFVISFASTSTAMMKACTSTSSFAIHSPAAFAAFAAFATFATFAAFAAFVAFDVRAMS